MKYAYCYLYPYQVSFRCNIIHAMCAQNIELFLTRVSLWKNVNWDQLGQTLS